jgi:hypothetical protein
MKNLLLVLLVIVSLNLKAQNCLTRDSIYQNFDEKLVHSEVVIVDSISKSELIKLIKNWGGLTFVNLKEVLVSETENQLVFNYITSNSGGSITSSTYVRLVIMLKDGRIKASFYDDGNVAAVGYPARTYYFTSSFPKPESTLCYKGGFKSYYEIYKSYKLKIFSTMQSLKTALTNPSKVDDDF